MKNIRDLTREELNYYINSIGEKEYRAKQIFEWLHNKRIKNIDEMSNISNALKNNLKSNFRDETITIYKRYDSTDGSKKYVFRLYDGEFIETVLLNAKYGYSICISSQVGCNMGCLFCASGKNGLRRNLDANEMLSQIYEIEKDLNINIGNIVIMGSGEPLNNLKNVINFLKNISDKDGKNISLRNITLSTCGIVEKVYELADLKLNIYLAISLHAPNDDIRKKIMPIAKIYSIDELFKAIKYYYDKTKRRITFEYSIMKNINDSIDISNQLVSLLNQNLKNVDYIVNLIKVNDIGDKIFEEPTEEDVMRFKNNLEKNKIKVTIRRRQGIDISASCGQLVAKLR